MHQGLNFGTKKLEDSHEGGQRRRENSSGGYRSAAYLGAGSLFIETFNLLKRPKSFA